MDSGLVSSTLHCAAVLFDLDGVLVDSTAAVEAVWTAFARRHGLDAAGLMEDLHGRRMADILRSALPGLTEAGLAREAALLEDAEVEGASDAVAIPGATGLTASMRDSLWAIVTSGTVPVAMARIGAVGLARPPVLVTADDVTAGKPSPEPYLLAAERLGVEPRRCVVIEDAPSGLRAGRAAGAVTIGVTTSHPPEHLGDADHVVASVGAIERVSAPDHAEIRLRFKR